MPMRLYQRKNRCLCGVCGVIAIAAMGVQGQRSTTLTTDDKAAGDTLGSSASVRGDTASVGAAYNDAYWTDSTSVELNRTSSNYSADCDGNGIIDTRDTLCFLNQWVPHQLTADCDGNGQIDSRDLICFFNLWAPAR